MNPFILLLSNIIELYSIAILIWIVLGVLVYFKIVNRSHILVSKTNDFLSRIIEPVLNPIRRYLPPINGIDISPVVLILLLNFLQNALFYYSARL